MEIKMSLSQLFTAFGEDGMNSELPPAIQRFAARLTVLVAHVIRVDKKIDALAALDAAERDALAKKFDGMLSEIADHVIELKGQQPPEAAAGAPANTPAEAPSSEEAEGESDDVDEATTKAMVEKALAETEAEAAAATQVQKPVAPVTPLRKPNSDKKPAEEAS